MSDADGWRSRRPRRSTRIARAESDHVERSVDHRSPCARSDPDAAIQGGTASPRPANCQIAAFIRRDRSEEEPCPQDQDRGEGGNQRTRTAPAPTREAHEGEDIRVSPLPTAEALAALAEGRIANSMSIIALQWLALNHEALRRRWLGADARPT